MSRSRNKSYSKKEKRRPHSKHSKKPKRYFETNPIPENDPKQKDVQEEYLEKARCFLDNLVRACEKMKEKD